MTASSITITSTSTSSSSSRPVSAPALIAQDKNTDNKEQAETKFKEISEAYEVGAQSPLHLCAVPGQWI